MLRRGRQAILNPARASTAAPVQTEAISFTLPSIWRTESSRAATPSGSALSCRSGPTPPAAGDHQEIRGIDKRLLHILVRQDCRAVGAPHLVELTPNKGHCERIGRWVRRHPNSSSRAISLLGAQSGPLLQMRCVTPLGSPRKCGFRL